MLLNAGIATIWRAVNTAPAGDMPDMQYTQQYFQSFYGDKTVGITRFWTAKAHEDQADFLIEIQRNSGIKTSDRCQLEPNFNEGNAGYYRILQVQHLLNDDGLPVTDLTLERIEAIDES